jgi:hypothetical protein
MCSPYREPPEGWQGEITPEEKLHRTVGYDEHDGARRDGHDGGSGGRGGNGGNGRRGGGRAGRGRRRNGHRAGGRGDP